MIFKGYESFFHNSIIKNQKRSHVMINFEKGNLIYFAQKRSEMRKCLSVLRFKGKNNEKMNISS